MHDRFTALLFFIGVICVSLLLFMLILAGIHGASAQSCIRHNRDWHASNIFSDGDCQ